MDNITDSITRARPAQDEDEARLVLTYGTPEPPVPWRRVSLGPLSFLLSDQSIRRIAWHSTELVRAICWPIRDDSWGTFPATTLDQSTVRSEGRVTGRIEQSVDGGRLGLSVEFSASEEGALSVSVTMRPKDGDFATNRAGLTVLHPIKGLTGAPVILSHPDGSREDSQFPELVMPSQPMKEISGLAYEVGPARVEISFEGEVFEMEDQRNWSDASYKTYCVPLEEPFTYKINSPLTQTVLLSFSGDLPAGSQPGGDPPPRLERLGHAAPELGLALEDGWEGDAAAQALTEHCGASHLLVRIDAATSPKFLTAAATLARRLSAPIEAELLLDDAGTEADLERLAQTLAKAGIAPRHVIALPAAYLKSYQPTAVWPEGPKPSALIEAMRRLFPDARIGGGMLTNFTEFNRCPPDAARCDFIFHGNSATVHASDDLSVIETIETLPHIFRSAKALSEGAAYRLGLVSIGMRTNPYGSAISENRAQVRETMARPDPRHRGLFAAAWAVGVLTATGDEVEALCLAAPTGPFGVIYAPQPYSQPGFDDGDGVVTPLFHVLRRAQTFAGQPRVTLSGLPEDIMAYGAEVEGETRLIIANLSQVRRRVALPDTARVKILDTASARAAMADPNWLDTTPEQPMTSLDLAPFAVAFLTSERPS